ncbi:hypothetical protein [Vibrio sp. 1F279]|uniref:hypothetical protein n=1 Tax=unclassified Vibrio TaxID=2614977 RepID=UPI00352C3DA8
MRLISNGEWAAKGVRNLDVFEIWKVPQTEGDCKQIVYRGQLNRIEVAKGLVVGEAY